MFIYLRNSFCLITLLFVSTSYGQLYSSHCPGEIGVAVEWLYMHTSYGDAIYGNKTTALDVPNSVTVVNVQDYTGWHSGYRIDLSYRLNCCSDIRLRWTHIPCFTSTNTVKGRFTSEILVNLTDPDTLLPAIGSEGFVKDRIHFYYLDLLMGFNLIDNCSYLLTLRGGPQYLRFKFIQDARIFNVSPNNGNPDPGANFTSDLWGVGPELGFDFSYFFCNGFNLAIRNYNSLLISDRVPTLSSIDTNDFSAFETSQSGWYVLPFINARMGLAYNSSYCMHCCDAVVNFNYNVEIGYEVLWLYNAIMRNAETSVTSDLMSYALHGPYLRAGVAF